MHLRIDCYLKNMVNKIKHQYYKFLFNRFLRRIPSFRTPVSGSTGVVTLAGHQHMPMLIYSLLSFHYYTNYAFPCFITDEGSLTPQDQVTIRKHLPNAIITTRSQTENKVIALLQKYPTCLNYRQIKFRDQFNVKLFDPFLLCPFKKVIYLDCDILFFRKPKAILEWAVSSNEYSLFATEKSEKELEFINPWDIIESMFREKINKNIPRRFNSGFLTFSKSRYQLEYIEDVLRYISKVGLLPTWTPEQYVLSTFPARIQSKDCSHDHIHLTSTQDNRLKNSNDYIFLHFAYQSKLLFYSYAFKLLKRTHFFAN